ncbi:recombinase family protein [Pleurocapsa sp. PCC 7319]|uniref:recombinase family protein n=1 Tax=Pleurocapsa sp. PCC 7319 TaxID=118161 RepID=UPI0003474D3C|nr:recombinase family protein [Pleurocapsa sp. PCC 7319]
MKIIAYLYSDPLLEVAPNQEIWGLEINQVYQDFGKHEQLEQLIADCQQDKPDFLLIRRLDELGKNISIISDRLAQLESLGIKIIATEQDYNSFQWEQASNFDFTYNNDLKLNLSRLLQQIQVSSQSIRLKQGHARNRLKILPPPGKAPYGYRRGQDKYIIDKSTAPVVKDFFERFLLFGSLRGAVRYLEKRYGKKISPSTGRNWLINPVYRGDLKYKNKDLISNTHTPIINREEAAQIDRLLRRNSLLPPRTASAPRSLAGLVICQQCQLTMNITRVTRYKKNTEYLYLRCHSCPQNPKCKAIAYPEVLTQTIEKICAELPLAVAQLNLPDKTALEGALKTKVKQKQDIINQLPTLLKTGILDQETAAIRNYKLRTEISQLEKKIAQLPPGNLQAIAKDVSLPQFWLDLSESERRFYFREFIKQVEIIRENSQLWKLNLRFIF